MRLEFLMDVGKNLPAIPPGMHGEIIKGCASLVEIYRAPDGTLYGSANSALVRGIVTTLIAIAEAKEDFSEFDKLKLNLGSSRMSGKAAMIEYLENLPHVNQTLMRL